MNATNWMVVIVTLMVMAKAIESWVTIARASDSES